MTTKIESALKDLQNGKMILLTDSPDREDEGDLIFPAEMITPETMNFMIRYSSGVVCLALTAARLRELQLPLMVPPHENTTQHSTPLTVSIDASNGITTGVSAADRAKTIQIAIHEDTKPEDLVKPGHVFPLQAKAGGVLERAGHTEGSIDIVRLAGFKPAAVIGEMMNPDGSMMRGSQLKEFAEQHQLTILSIEEIITHRMRHETVIEETASAILPLEHYGLFNLTVIKEKFNHQEHMVLFKENQDPTKPLLVRVHSACMTGDLFGSERCDCNHQLHYSLKMISEEGGLLIYLNQEGRGIGLLNKIKAYGLQEHGADTVEANHQLGLSADLRKYYLAAHVLRNMDVSKIRLLTNNPHKVDDLIKYGIEDIERISLPVFENVHNKKYLFTKQNKLNHFMGGNLSLM